MTECGGSKAVNFLILTCTHKTVVVSVVGGRELWKKSIIKVFLFLMQNIVSNHTKSKSVCSFLK